MYLDGREHEAAFGHYNTSELFRVAMYRTSKPLYMMYKTAETENR